MKHLIPIFFLFFAGTLAAEATEAADSRMKQDEKLDYVQMAKEIASLRSEVERIYNELSSQRKTDEALLKTLHLQEAELASQIDKEKLYRDQLSAKMSTVHKSLKDKQYQDANFEDVASKIYQDYKNYIQKNLPFRQAERLNSLENIWNSLQDKKLSEDQFLVRAWNSFSDEKRLTKGILLQKQEILIGDETHKAELVKVGNIALLFKSQSNQYGFAERSKSHSWKFQVTEDSDFKKSVDRLIEGLKLQIRSGVYDIPTVALLKEPKK
jgi:seryl-tRNA synthetase